MSTVATGNAAERAVAAYLTNLGYVIIEQNWKIKIAEIDLVAKKDKSIFFVEVKYRATTAAGGGLEYVTKQKLIHMQRAAEAWVLAHNWRDEYVLMAAAVDASGTIELVEVLDT